MDLIRNFKIHAAALIIVVLAELVGVQKFGLVVLLPLLYALVFGALVSFPRWSVVRLDEMNRAGKMLSVGVLLLITKIALDIGPNIEMIMQSGWALIMQEFGHFFGTLIFGLPVALLVGMKREAIGACYSIDREPNVAIISERFGLDSPEGHGVMGMYVCGTVFGALWVSVLAGVIAQMGSCPSRRRCLLTAACRSARISTPLSVFPGALFRWRWPSVRAASSAQLCSLKSFCILKASSDALRQLYSPAQVRTVQVHWAGAEFVIDR